MDMKSKHKTREALFMYINYPFLYMVSYICFIIFSKIYYRLKILFLRIMFFKSKPSLFNVRCILIFFLIPVNSFNAFTCFCYVILTFIT